LRLIDGEVESLGRARCIVLLENLETLDQVQVDRSGYAKVSDQFLQFCRRHKSSHLNYELLVRKWPQAAEYCKSKPLARKERVRRESAAAILTVTDFSTHKNGVFSGRHRTG